MDEAKIAEETNGELDQPSTVEASALGAVIALAARPPGKNLVKLATRDPDRLVEIQQRPGLPLDSGGVVRTQHPPVQRVRCAPCGGQAAVAPWERLIRGGRS
jgi:hypothetical protein